MLDEKIIVEFQDDETLNEESYLWKYVDLHKFLSFVLNQKLYLTRLDKFEDLREGIAPSHLLIQMIKEEMDNHPVWKSIQAIMTVDNLPTEMNRIEDELEQIQKFNFANCWFIEDKGVESVAMWNLYSRPNSVAIRIKYRNFKNQILSNGFRTDKAVKKVILAPVRYVNFRDKEELKKISKEPHSSVFIKDLSFAHENEFRIIAEQEKMLIPKKKHKKGTSRRRYEELYNSVYDFPGINLLMENFFNYKFEIVFHPKSEAWAIEDIKNVMVKNEIPFVILDSKLKLK